MRAKSLSPLVLAILALLSVRPVGAQEAVSLGYNVYVGGFHVFAFDVDLTLNRSEYAISASGGTKGVVGLFYDWSVRIGAKGAVGRRGLRSARYDVLTDDMGRVEAMRLRFEARGRYSIEREPPKKGKRKRLAPEITLGAVDPLSAIFAATFALVEDGRCRRTIPVFDGKRRYDLRFSHVGPAAVEPSYLSVFRGPATQCRVTMTRIAGFTKKRRYAMVWDDSEDSPFTVWVARLADGLPPLPVRFENDLRLGLMIIHLARAEIDGAPARATRFPIPDSDTARPVSAKEGAKEGRD